MRAAAHVHTFGGDVLGFVSANARAVRFERGCNRLETKGAGVDVELTTDEAALCGVRVLGGTGDTRALGRIERRSTVETRFAAVAGRRKRWGAVGDSQAVAS